MKQKILKEESKGNLTTYFEMHKEVLYGTKVNTYLHMVFLMNTAVYETAEVQISDDESGFSYKFY